MPYLNSARLWLREHEERCRRSTGLPPRQIFPLLTAVSVKTVAA
jgi:hypothetical protein